MRCAPCAGAWFQSTHPRGVRLQLQRAIPGHTQFQSTHPRGVRPVDVMPVTAEKQVSIHAPAWGATLTLWDCAITHGVSIHAPAWGATDALDVAVNGPQFQSTHPRGVRHGTSGHSSRRWMFQSTHPRGVRHARFNRHQEMSHVSIHAPAWGATSAQKLGSSSPALFQSTHPRGVRRRSRGAVSMGISFNPRTRVGCDAQCVQLVGRVLRFNPRTRVGCDCFHVLSSRFP